ncbi:MBL fold metallo-hydrolase [OCS116 cluster bacterium]|nr:MBL fold metallo-hydrolase [OCS116 cluster bacterium]
MKKIIITFFIIFFYMEDVLPSNNILSTDEAVVELLGSPDDTEIRIQKITENLFLFFGLGGNIAVLVGDDGVLIVDDQIPSLIPKIKDAIKEIGGGDLVYTINTHWHFDHAEGNLALDPNITKIISQSNARDYMAKGGLIDMVANRINQEPYPDYALPVITYENGMTLYFNNEEIEIVHFGPAHTSGDSAVIFHNQNAIHYGDVFVTEGYPFIDVSSGGSIDGIINFLSQSLTKLKSGAIILPGHGEIATIQDVEDTVSMLKTIRGRILKMIDEGKSLQEVIDAKPTKDFDEKYPDWLGNFVNRAYTSLKEDR